MQDKRLYCWKSLKAAYMWALFCQEHTLLLLLVQLELLCSYPRQLSVHYMCIAASTPPMSEIKMIDTLNLRGIDHGQQSLK